MTRETIAAGATGTVAFMIAIGLVVIVGGFAWIHEPTPVPTHTTEAEVESPVEAPPGVTLHVAGAVASPGLVVVAVDARVADAIAAAGGASASGDLGAVNLAAPVVDGMQLFVPTTGSETGSVGSARTADGKIDLNRASAEELAELPGVGAVLAGRISDHRDENGPFGSVEDLLDVSGIGEGKLAAIRDVAVAR